MKRIQVLVLAMVFLLFGSCKKSGTPTPQVTQAGCKPAIESTTLSGNEATYEYTYDANGKITTIKKFVGGAYHVLQDSIVVGDNTIVRYAGINYPAGSRVVTVVFDRSMFDAFPTKAVVAITEGAITQTDVFTYFFFYDSKNRVIKVGEQTDHVAGDWEYDLSVFFDDNDNVTGLSYEFTTGPNTVTNIAVSGYDDKPTPFAALKNWYFFMHAGWDNYDPEPIFTALSKNNPLGYTMPDGFKRAMTYIYGDNGFPVKRMNTNTNTSGTYSFEETYSYECQ